MHGLARKNEAHRDISKSGEDSLLAEAAELRALPAFPQAVQNYTAGLAGFRESLRLFNKLLAQETRFRTVRYLLYLDADRERFGPDGGASYGRLLQLCTRRQEISPRVLKTMLALLTLSGFVTIRRGETDRRLTFYHPTDRMMGFARQRIGNAADTLDLLQPQLQRARMLQDDPRFVQRTLIAAGREHITATPPTDRMPEFIAFFGGHEGAAPVVFSIMLGDMQRTPTPSRAQIAARFGLSKTQVSNIITEGAALGFFTLDTAGVPTPTPHLRDSYQRWISIELAYHARHMQPM
jgi:hypothetical protein